MVARTIELILTPKTILLLQLTPTMPPSNDSRAMKKYGVNAPTLSTNKLPMAITKLPKGIFNNKRTFWTTSATQL